MGNPLKRRAIKGRLERWTDDLVRLTSAFGDYDPGEDSHAADVQRALETLIDKGEALLGHLTPREVHGR